MLAPELDLFAQPPQPEPVRRGPPPDEVRERLMSLRDELVASSSNGRYNDAASREWRELTNNWRMALLLIAGVGDGADDLGTLASRSWQEMPPPEREQLRSVIRDAKKHLTRLVALAARV